MQHIYQTYLKSSGVCTDTRSIKNNCLFFALKGDNFNGNIYAKQAIESGALAAIIDEKEYHIPSKTILVDDVLTTLQQLATHHRETLSSPIIALTGSNGKTTTKELLNAVLSEKFKTYATKGNLNNHIGVPISLLEMNETHEIGIIEMGASNLKEIAFLAEIAKPDFGVITNIGKAHLEGFGSLEGVKKGKRELYDYLEQQEGTVFYNDDDLVLKEKLPNIETIPYGENCDVNCTVIDSSNLLSVGLTINNQNIKINTSLVGEYNLTNISCAACIGNFFQIDIDKIKDGLEKYSPSNNRSQLIKTKENIVILDAYNANPSSMELALINFSKRPEPNKIAILGDMLEIGPESIKEHQSIIRLLENFKLDHYLVGKEFYKASNHSKKAFLTTSDLHAYFSQHPVKNSILLIKGSRGIKLESLQEIL